MVELAAASIHTVAPLFGGIDHSVALVYAVLEGNSPGRVFVGARDNPTSALLLSMR